MDFNELNNKKNKYSLIRNLYFDRKYNAFLNEANKYLELYPMNIGVRYMRGIVNRTIGNFNEAIFDFKYILEIKEDSPSLLELYYIYYYLNMYKEAIELLPHIYKQSTIRFDSISISELVMKKSLGIDMKVKKDKNDYVKSQIFNYSSSLALEHIQKHIKTSEEINGNTSYFNDNIDLEYLLKTVRDNIKNSNKINCREVLEIHIFGISNIGYYKDLTCNYIKAVVIPNTDYVINMYPINSIGCFNISNLDYDYNKLFKNQEKTKVLSMIDKFNKRYGRV